MILFGVMTAIASAIVGVVASWWMRRAPHAIGQQLALFDREPLAGIAVDLEEGGMPRTYVRWGGAGFQEFLAGRTAR